MFNLAEFSSAQAKVERARLHVMDLAKQDAEWAMQADFQPIISMDPTRGEGMQQDLVCRFTAADSPADWPLIAGDAIQNARSALDHVAHALVMSATRDPTLGRKSAFKIITHRLADEASIEAELVKGGMSFRGVTDSEALAYLAKIQPIVAMPANPESHPLALLSELNNMDKHRLLLSTRSTILPYRQREISDKVVLDKQYPDLPPLVGQELLENATVKVTGSIRTVGATVLHPAPLELWRQRVELSMEFFLGAPPHGGPDSWDILDGPKPTITFGPDERPSDTSRLLSMVAAVDDIVEWFVRWGRGLQ